MIPGLGPLVISGVCARAGRATAEERRIATTDLAKDIIVENLKKPLWLIYVRTPERVR
jgi:hypothetical protein